MPHLMDDEFGPLVQITWWDHTGSDHRAWGTPAEMKIVSIPTKVESVGWVINETKTIVVIVAARNALGQAASDQCILKNCIIKRRFLK